MSEIAGRLPVQQASQILLQTRGVLLGGIAGVDPAHVVVVGGGTAGAQAVDVAVGMGARVTVVDINTDTLRRFMARYDGRVECVHSTPENLTKACSDASVLVGAVLVPGAKAPKVIDDAVLGALPEGAVVVGIAIDQGGCTVASRPTSHSEPTFTHGTTTMYCVTNMPGAAPVTATLALAAETLPHVRALAGGVDAALEANPHLVQGVNVRGGEVVLEAIKTKS